MSSKSKRRAQTKKGINQIKQGVKTTTQSIVGEIDDAKDIVIKDIRDGFNVVKR